jgi:hypothetical protein
MRSSLASLLLLACLPLALAACGDDDGGGGAEAPQVFEVQANEEGVTAPESARPGAIEIRFTNTGKGEHSAQIVAVGEGHTPAEVKKAGEAWGDEGKPLPEWLSFVGGIGSTKGGEAASAVVDLPPGEYAAFDIESDAATPYAEFTVEGDEGESLPETEARVEASEYTFTAESLTSTGGPVLFENAGEEPHHLIAAPLKPGKTKADVENFLKNEKGAPPIDESKGINTAILSGGTSTVVDLKLQSGEYALLCFVPDRAGGPPHAFKGMATTATVD